MARSSKQRQQSNREALAGLISQATSDGSEILDTLMRILRDDGARHSDRIDAAKTLLDRGWGRSVETITVEQSGPSVHTTALADAALAALAERLATPRQIPATIDGEIAARAPGEEDDKTPDPLDVVV